MKIAEQTSPIYEKIRLLCNNNNLEIFALYREIYPDCNSRGNLSTWRKGNFKPVDLIYISNRFDVSIDYLLNKPYQEKKDEAKSLLGDLTPEEIKKVQEYIVFLKSQRKK